MKTLQIIGMALLIGSMLFMGSGVGRAACLNNWEIGVVVNLTGDVPPENDDYGRLWYGKVTISCREEPHIGVINFATKSASYWFSSSGNETLSVGATLPDLPYPYQIISTTYGGDAKPDGTLVLGSPPLLSGDNKTAIITLDIDDSSK